MKLKELRRELKDIVQSSLYDRYNCLNEVDINTIKAIIKLFAINSKTKYSELIQNLERHKTNPTNITNKIALLCEDIENIEEKQIIGLLSTFISFIGKQQELEDSDLLISQKVPKEKSILPTRAIKVPTMKEKTAKKISVVDKNEEKQDNERTKRFDKFHKNWSGNEAWKVNSENKRNKDIFQNDNLDTADDDDYLSAWLECLKNGVPWGGRGAGGRGVQKTVGESKNVLVYGVSINRGTNTLLDNSVLKLNEGKRYGLIGLNGSGKTTLMRRIATGRLPGFPPYLSVQQVQQEINFHDNVRLGDLLPIDFILKFDTVRTDLLATEQDLLKKIELESNDELQQQLSELYLKLEQLQVYSAEIRAEELLRSFQFTNVHFKTKMRDLSGGWKMKACLAGALFTTPDILLLDEPTNHLDISAVEELEKFLNDSSNFDGTVLIVSHDRSFINNVCNEIIILKNQTLNYFKGTYSEFIELKKQKSKSQTRLSGALDRKKDHLKKIIQTSRNEKDNTSKQKLGKTRKKKLERLDRIGFGRQSGHRFKEQVDHTSHAYKEHIPQAIELDDKPQFFSFPQIPSTSIKTLVSASNISISIKDKDCERQLFNGFSAEIESKARIGLVGPNGCGKTTLLRGLFTEDLSSNFMLRGSIRKQPSLKIGYFSQEIISTLDVNLTACELLMKKSEDMNISKKINDFIFLDTIEKTRQYLGSFGLKKDTSVRKIETLSGGQKSRVVFALECLNKPELLILDEPSNHLDIESIEALTEAIKQFNGSIVLVSHDRSLLSDCISELWKFKNINKMTSIKIFKRLPNETTKEFFQQNLT